jgi:hypothetical protein
LDRLISPEVRLIVLAVLKTVGEKLMVSIVMSRVATPPRNLNWESTRAEAEFFFGGEIREIVGLFWRILPTHYWGESGQRMTLSHATAQ